MITVRQFGIIVSTLFLLTSSSSFAEHLIRTPGYCGDPSHGFDEVCKCASPGYCAQDPEKHNYPACVGTYPGYCDVEPSRASWPTCSGHKPDYCYEHKLRRTPGYCGDPSHGHDEICICANPGYCAQDPEKHDYPACVGTNPGYCEVEPSRASWATCSGHKPRYCYEYDWDAQSSNPKRIGQPKSTDSARKELPPNPAQPKQQDGNSESGMGF